MRNQMHEALQRACGPVARSQEGCDWWKISHDGHGDIHICLNAPHDDSFAHVLIFDPAAKEDGEHVHDLSARNDGEIQKVLALIVKLRGTVPGHGIEHDGGMHDGSEHDGSMHDGSEH